MTAQISTKRVLVLNTPVESRAAKHMATAITVLLTSIAVFAVLAYGAVEPWSVTIFRIATAVLLVLWAVSIALAGRTPKWNPLFAPMLLFASVVGLQLAFGLSAYRWATESEAANFFAYAVLFVVATDIFSQRSQARRFLWLMTVFGYAYSCFAVIQQFTSAGKLYWMRVPRQGGWIYGSFVNHGHYAALMEMLAFAPLVLVAKVCGLDIGKRVILITAFLLMASSIFLSGSRVGMFAVLVQLGIFAALDRSWMRSHRAKVIALTVVILAGAALIFLGGTALSDRLGTLRTPFADNSRLIVAKDTLKLVRERPLLGWGLDAFPEVYPRVSSLRTRFFVNAAHNEYLQFLAETGILGFGAITWFLVAAIRRSSRLLRSYNHPATLAGIVGLSGVLLHCIADFPFRIPADAAPFFILVALAVHDRE
jgi:O-antigen ligase